MAIDVGCLKLPIKYNFVGGITPQGEFTIYFSTKTAKPTADSCDYYHVDRKSLQYPQYAPENLSKTLSSGTTHYLTIESTVAT